MTGGEREVAVLEHAHRIVARHGRHACAIETLDARVAEAEGAEALGGPEEVARVLDLHRADRELLADLAELGGGAHDLDRRAAAQALGLEADEPMPAAAESLLVAADQRRAREHLPRQHGEQAHPEQAALARHLGAPFDGEVVAVAVAPGGTREPGAVVVALDTE